MKSLFVPISVQIYPENLSGILLGIRVEIPEGIPFEISSRFFSLILSEISIELPAGTPRMNLLDIPRRMLIGIVSGIPLGISVMIALENQHSSRDVFMVIMIWRFSHHMD